MLVLANLVTRKSALHLHQRKKKAPIELDENGMKIAEGVMKEIRDTFIFRRNGEVKKLADVWTAPGEAGYFSTKKIDGGVTMSPKVVVPYRDTELVDDSLKEKLGEYQC